MTIIPRDKEAETAGHMPTPGHWMRHGADIVLSCPRGHRNAIIHQIDNEGTLSPSYQCSTAGCDYHVMPMRLNDWSAP